MNRKLKQKADRLPKKQVPDIPDLAVAQTLEDVREIVFKGELLVMQQLKHGDTALSHQINAHMLGAAAILHLLFPRTRSA